MLTFHRRINDVSANVLFLPKIKATGNSFQFYEGVISWASESCLFLFLLLLFLFVSEVPEGEFSIINHSTEYIACNFKIYIYLTSCNSYFSSYCSTYVLLIWHNH